MAYYNNLMVSRGGIKECTSRCQCWSSIYDKCRVSKEMLLQQQEERKKAAATKAAVTKSLEMEDMSSIKIRITAEENSSGRLDGGGVVEEEEGQRAFRSRATTLSSKPRLTRTSDVRNHDKLHSRRANSASKEDRDTKMVAGASEHAQNSSRTEGLSSTLDHPSGHQALRSRSGTVSGGSRSQRGPSSRLSPRLDRKLHSQSGGQFEDSVGLFLKILMDKLMEMMQHPPTVNILLTRLIVRLAYYPQPLLRSLLLNHQLVLKPGVPNLLTVSLSRPL